jgi:hypothetical protein
MSQDLPPLKIDKSKFKVFDNFADAEADEIEFWISTSYEERLEYAYRLRHMAYGDKIRGPIQRVIDVVQSA